VKQELSILSLFKSRPTITERELNPHSVPAHIFRIRREARAEHDFDYYMQ
jgi:hypothetical protein